MSEVFSRGLTRRLLVMSFPVVLFTGCQDLNTTPARSQNSGDPAATPTSEVETPAWRKRPAPSPAPSLAPTPTVTPAPTTPTTSPTATPTTSMPTYDALFYWGAGVEATGAQALLDILTSHGLTYQIVNEVQLNGLSQTQLADFKTIVWPGGDSNVASAALTPDTRNRIRTAVQNGVSFAGFCAGAWMAVGPAPGTQPPIWGLALLQGNYLKEYNPNGPGGVMPVAAMVPSTFANGTVRDLVWWGGPVLPSTAGTVIAKYPSGESAITQGLSGKGFVAISGPHPEAPQGWRIAQNLTDPDGLDTAIAWNLIQSALTKTPLQTF